MAENIFTSREWELVECTNPIQTGLFRKIIDTHHRYMKYKDTTNRRINWLVYHNGKIAGAFGVNSAILAMTARDAYIGWTKEQRLANLNMLANNYRFCLIEEHTTPSKLLSVAVKVAQKRWQEKYGNELVMIESLVKPPFQGTVYKAAGWTYVGMTKGYSFSKAPVKQWQREKSSRGELARSDPKAAIAKYAVGREHYHITKSEPKFVFVRPLNPLWREILTTRP